MRARSRDPLPKLWEKLGVTSATVFHRGRASVLYFARSGASGRPVVVKLLNTRALPPGRDETELWRMLSTHKGIQPLLQFGTTSTGHSYVVTEYCVDGSYDQVLLNDGPLPVDEVVAVGERIARGVEVVHAHGLLHHAITPDNILRTRFGATLIDFGATHPLDHPFPPVHHTWRTVEHTPPEELRGERPSPASDVYRLASTLWTLLAGHAPFAGAGGALVTQDEYRSRLLSHPAPPVPRDDVPDWLCAVLTRGLAKEPDQRFASADDLRHVLGERTAPELLATPTASTTGGSTSDRDTSAEQGAAPTTRTSHGPAQWHTEPGSVRAASGEPNGQSGPRDDGFGVHPPVDMPSDFTSRARRRMPRARWLVITAAALVAVAGGLGIARVVGDTTEKDGGGDQAERSATGAQEGQPDERIAEEDVANAATADEDELPDRDTESPDIAPTDVEIRDGIISATISWTDGSGGTASHYVVGGPTGEQAATLANVAPGTSEVEVNGLNPDVEYCFTVVAVLSTDALVPSEEHCAADENDG